MSGLIELRGVTKWFPGQSGDDDIMAVDSVDLDIDEGAFVAVMGPSGCGKSTLLNIIAGFEKADAGTCRIGGRTIASAGPDRAVVFQEYALFPWMTVEQNVSFAMRAADKWNDDAPARITTILSELGLLGFRRSFPKALSGGMRQRVAIARVLAIDSPVMLMDEPFGALDALTRTALQEELVRLWQKTRKSVFFVTHSVDEALFLADRVIVMTQRPGRIVLDRPIDLARPRDVTHVDFNSYKREILGVINPMLQNAATAEAVR